MRSFRDRDYIITPEGFIFTVIGNIHPVERVIAYLKYVPDDRGKWGRGRSRYRRALEHYNVPSVVDSMELLRANAPRYLFESTVHGITLPAVPTDRIAQHLRPEQRRLQLESTEDRDELEDRTLELIDLISKNTGVPAGSFGVTGSVLARIHDPTFSDVDLVVYGFNNAVRVRSFMQNLKDSFGTVRRLTGEPQEKWIAERLKSTPLTRQDSTELLARKWNIGLFDGTEFSIHAVHTESEVHERYGDECYVPLGIVEATARVTRDDEALFMPAVYEVELIDHELGSLSHEVDQIVSFEGLYADIARPGETIACRGKLERVESSSGSRHRIVIGSPEAKGTDYVLPIPR